MPLLSCIFIFIFISMLPTSHKVQKLKVTALTTTVAADHEAEIKMLPTNVLYRVYVVFSPYLPMSLQSPSQASDKTTPP